MSERIPSENNYDMLIDVAAQRVFELITQIENETRDPRLIRLRLLEFRSAETNQLVADSLEAMAGIFETMSDSSSISPTMAAGFDANTAYLFASPFVDEDVKAVFHQLINQKIGGKR